MNPTRTPSRRSFKFPRVDSVASALMLAVGFTGVCILVVQVVLGA